ncbi:MAG: uracil-DNA glycosylase family protein [Rhizobiaceae bacterium]|nr:uracil-DNA glycosylase family protein [Rhizobiaceae bacterium]
MIDSWNDLYELDRSIRGCDKCAPLFKRQRVNPGADDSPVVPSPVLSSPFRAQILLIGQAPGLREYATGMPFCGGAGQAIRRLFEECGLKPELFEASVYQTSAAKCFPGRKLDRGRLQDLPPCRATLRNCQPYLGEQIRLIDPSLIVCLGRVAMEALDALRHRKRRSMTDALGRAEEWGHRVVVMLAHTSGASTLLNDEGNRRRQAMGLECIASAIRALGLNK